MISMFCTDVVYDWSSPIGVLNHPLVQRDQGRVQAKLPHTSPTRPPPSASRVQNYAPVALSALRGHRLIILPSDSPNTPGLYTTTLLSTLLTTPHPTAGVPKTPGVPNTRVGVYRALLGAYV